MITDTIDAWQVEQGDFITLGGEEVFEVVSIADNLDYVDFALADDDGDQEVFSFLADDQITLVVSLDPPGIVV